MDLNIVSNEEKFLAGKLEGYTLKGAENKFDDKGNPLPFPGCAIICNIPLNTNSVSYTHLTMPKIYSV